MWCGTSCHQNETTEDNVGKEHGEREDRAALTANHDNNKNEDDDDDDDEENENYNDNTEDENDGDEATDDNGDDDADDEQYNQDDSYVADDENHEVTEEGTSPTLASSANVSIPCYGSMSQMGQWVRSHKFQTQVYNKRVILQQ